MPHLQFEINKKLNKKDKIKFINFIEESFSKMQTGTDHIAISIKELEKRILVLGEQKNNNLICLMNLDIRSGRTKDQKKINLVKSFISGVEKFFGIKKQFQYVTFTNHDGVEFNFFEKSLSEWIKNDDPANQ